MRRDTPKPGQESVWDYPRPPRAEAVPERIRVKFNGVVIADTTAAWRVLETSHPPVYYIPPGDIRPDCLEDAPGSSFCEWKGQARYYTVRVGDRVSEKCAWSYGDPPASLAAIRDHIAFYAHGVDACFVGDEQVVPQDGSFYGGWITARIVGPFKGGPGTWGW